MVNWSGFTLMRNSDALLPLVLCVDMRQLLEFRPVHVSVGNVQTADSSALVRLGDTVRIWSQFLLVAMVLLFFLST